MAIESVVRYINQSPVKASLADPGFVTRDEQNSAACRVKSKCYSPHAIIGVEAKLFHVGVSRSIKRVYLWASQLRTKGLQVYRMGKKFTPNVVRKPLKLAGKLRMILDDPTHPPIMLCKS